MHADEPLGAVGRGPQTGDRNRGGIAGEQRIRPQMRGQFLEDRPLHVFLFGRGLDDQIAAAEIGEVGAGMDSRQRDLLVFRAQLTLGDLTLERAVDRSQRLGQLIGVGVLERDLQAGDRADMRDPRTHLAGADNPDLSDVHAGPLE